MTSPRLFKVGVQLQPQNTSIENLRTAWRAADEMGVDSIWTWDHFYPLYGNPEANHFEGWSLLAAAAVETKTATIGMLVSGNTYRNPDLLADIARTVDHLSGGRCVLGMGAGWFERDYDEYGYEFGTAPDRLRALEVSLQRIKARISKLTPQPISKLPILIGGGGEKVTLRLVAQYADMWNTFGPAENFAAKSAVLDEWCAKVGRDPAQIERTVLLSASDAGDAEKLVAAGASHVIVGITQPFDLSPVEELLDLAIQ